MGAEVTKSLFVVVEMLCIVLVMVYCTFAFILIYSVRGIGTVLDSACNIIYVYKCIYVCTLYESL